MILKKIIKKMDVNKNDNVNRVIRSKYLHVELMKSLSECLCYSKRHCAVARVEERGDT